VSTAEYRRQESQQSVLIWCPISNVAASILVLLREVLGCELVSILGCDAVWLVRGTLLHSASQKREKGDSEGPKRFLRKVGTSLPNNTAWPRIWTFTNTRTSRSMPVHIPTSCITKILLQYRVSGSPCVFTYILCVLFVYLSLLFCVFLFLSVQAQDYCHPVKAQLQ
jgi:hypothetical protein